MKLIYQGACCICFSVPFLASLSTAKALAWHRTWFKVLVTQVCLTLCDPTRLLSPSRKEYWSGLPFPSPGTSFKEVFLTNWVHVGSFISWAMFLESWPCWRQVGLLDIFQKAYWLIKHFLLNPDETIHPSPIKWCRKVQFYSSVRWDICSYQ